MVRKLNKFRRRHGLGPLRYSADLSRSATRYASFLIRTDRFGHASRIWTSKRFSSAGETLAYQPGWRVRRSQAIRMWLRSPGHRPLLLTRSFRYVGAGRSKGRFGSRRATIWVLHFGR